jgi:hypothetical protein
MNYLAKLLLIATSLSPLLGAVAINQYVHSEPYWWAWLAVGGLLVFICWALLRHMGKKIQSNSFTIISFEGNDKEVLAFLLTYLLPFIASEKLAFTGEWMTGNGIHVHPKISEKSIQFEILRLTLFA